MFDVDGSGSISVIELNGLCEKLGLKVKDDELRALMKLMDRDGSGSVDFEEFATVMAEQVNFFLCTKKNKLLIFY